MDSHLSRSWVVLFSCRRNHIRLQFNLNIIPLDTILRADNSKLGRPGESPSFEIGRRKELGGRRNCDGSLYFLKLFLTKSAELESE